MSETRARKVSEKKHICLQCGSAFNRPYRLKLHEKIHQNIKEFVCGEPNCNKSYTNKSHLDRHIQNVHMEPAVDVIYSCPDCMKVYANRQNLKRHIKNVHGRKTWFNCDVCSSSFKKKHQLSAHMYQHTFVKSFSCELCSNEFATLLEKKKHMKHHKTYSCDLCDMAFVQWSKYLKHKKMMHQEFVCDECGRKFYQRVHMIRHTKSHNPSYTPQFYPCTYENCERVYSRSSNLKQHIKMKHLKIKHECDICNAKLSTKARLLLHLETHSKPKELIQSTKVTGRKIRRDKGAVKTSTALRIAGLIIDPDDENIKGTLKSAHQNSNIGTDNIADSVTEKSIADNTKEQINTADTTLRQNMSNADTATEQINNADSTEQYADSTEQYADSVREQNGTANFGIDHKVLEHNSMRVLV